ncbi:MAG TPA: hypothetical protein VD971_06610 [Phycisphaerales bacterium]|nr:hypothetical protein [Phycisphaerales bacterium]
MLAIDPSSLLSQVPGTQGDAANLSDSLRAVGNVLTLFIAGLTALFGLGFLVGGRKALTSSILMTGGAIGLLAGLGLGAATGQGLWAALTGAVVGGAIGAALSYLLLRLAAASIAGVTGFLFAGTVAAALMLPSMSTRSVLGSSLGDLGPLGALQGGQLDLDALPASERSALHQLLAQSALPSPLPPATEAELPESNANALTAERRDPDGRLVITDDDWHARTASERTPGGGPPAAAASAVHAGGPIDESTIPWAGIAGVTIIATLVGLACFVLTLCFYERACNWLTSGLGAIHLVGAAVLAAPALGPGDYTTGGWVVAWTVMTLGLSGAGAAWHGHRDKRRAERAKRDEERAAILGSTRAAA